MLLMLLELIVFGHFSLALGSLAPDSIPKKGQDTKLVCTPADFSSAVNWYKPGDATIASTCANAGVCSVTNDGSYTFSANASSTNVAISTLTRSTDSGTWTCGTDTFDLVIYTIPTVFNSVNSPPTSPMTLGTDPVTLTAVSGNLYPQSAVTINWMYYAAAAGGTPQIYPISASTTSTATSDQEEILNSTLVINGNDFESLSLPSDRKLTVFAKLVMTVTGFPDTSVCSNADCNGPGSGSPEFIYLLVESSCPADAIIAVRVFLGLTCPILGNDIVVMIIAVLFMSRIIKSETCKCKACPPICSFRTHHIILAVITGVVIIPDLILVIVARDCITTEGMVAALLALMIIAVICLFLLVILILKGNWKIFDCSKEEEKGGPCFKPICTVSPACGGKKPAEAGSGTDKGNRTNSPSSVKIKETKPVAKVPGKTRTEEEKAKHIHTEDKSKESPRVTKLDDNPLGRPLPQHPKKLAPLEQKPAGQEEKKKRKKKRKRRSKEQDVEAQESRRSRTTNKDDDDEEEDDDDEQDEE